MGFIDHLKEGRLTIAVVSGVGSALYGIAEHTQQGTYKDWRAVGMSAILGAGIGAALGSVIAIGMGYSQGVGATPYTPILGAGGFVLPAAPDAFKLVTGVRSSRNKGLLRRSVIGATIGSIGGLAIDIYRGQM